MTRNLVRGTVVAAIFAALLNLLIYLIAQWREVPFIVTPSIASMPDTVSLGMVIIASLIAAVAAALVLWLIARFSDNPGNVFLWIALIIGLLSFIPLWQSTAWQKTGTFFALGLMHVAAALAITWSLIYFERSVYY